jgi:hypothetical protein
MEQELVMRVDAKGDAQFRFLARHPPSRFTDLLKLAFATSPAATRDEAIKQIQIYFARYGLETRRLECEVSGLKADGILEIFIEGEIANLARRSDNRWTISFKFVQPEEGAKEVLEDLRGVQTLLRLELFENAQLGLLEKIYVVLPSGAVLMNAEEIEERRKLWIDYGGGTYENGTARIETFEGKLAVVLETEGLITTENITITPQEFLQSYLAPKIEYSISQDKAPSYIIYGAVGAAALLLLAAALLLRGRGR